MNRDKNSKWIALGFVLTLIIFAFGLWLFVFPSELQDLSSETTWRLGVFAITFGLVGLALNMLMFFISKSWQARVLLSVSIMLCVLTIFSGWFAYGWSAQPGFTW